MYPAGVNIFAPGPSHKGDPHEPCNDFHHQRKGFDFSQAVAEADRCLLCHDAPCSAACPAQTDPGTFIRKLRLRNITGAIRTINPTTSWAGLWRPVSHGAVVREPMQRRHAFQRGSGRR